MTEPARALPAEDPQTRSGGRIAPHPLGPRGLPGQAPGRAAVERSPGATSLGVVPPTPAARPSPPVRRPVHVVVAVGMTAGLYALSLAGVTALQSAANAQLAADHAPAAGAVAGLKSAHDAMEASLGTLAGAYARAADGYRVIAKGITGHEQKLAALGQQVQAAAGSAAALSVPTLSLLPSGSGGAGAGSRGSTPAVQVPGVSVQNLAPLPAVSGSAVSTGSRPVVNACTTASGKPC